MKTFELQSFFKRPDGRLEVTYREKRFFAGASGNKTEVMTIEEFHQRFPLAKIPRPPKSKK